MTFIAGALVSTLVTDTIKYGVGRPRPHFLKLCAPYACTQNATAGILVDTHFLNCTNPHIGPHLKNNLRLSFISGHSSMAAYAATFLILYLHKRGIHIWIRSASVLTYLTQSILTCAALFIGMSQIWDHKHHYEDVACGLIEGATCAYAAWKFLVPTLHKDLLLTQLYEESGSNSSSSSSGGVGEFLSVASPRGVGVRGVNKSFMSRMPNI